MTPTELTSRRSSAWPSAMLGLAAAGLGLWLIVRPFASLRVLAVAISAGLIVIGISRTTAPESKRTTRILGAGWIIVGAVALFWPGVTVRMITFLVGIHLIVDGADDVLGTIRAERDQRIAGAILGVATILFGVLALLWPDITVLVVAIVFAARLIAFGVSRVVTAFRRHRSPGAPDSSGIIRRRLSVAGAVAALVVAGGLALVSSRFNNGAPVVDDFYTVPDNLPQEPGSLLRVEPFERGISESAEGWRILYTTTRDEGQPAVASALVVAPRETTGPAPVIAWAHGTTGVDQTCAPSVLEGTFSTGALFSVDAVVEQGWVLVATDYVGLGTVGPHPYLIGQGEGRSVLDSVRAARQMEGVSLQDETVVWGHSQGGHAALWTGALAPSYAPDAGVVGVAALAPASNLTGMMDSLVGVTGGSIFASYVISAYSDVYTDVRLDDYVVPGGDVKVRAVAGRCLAEPSVLTSVLSSVTLGFSSFASDLTSGALQNRFIENIPPYTIEAPLLLAQGAADTLVTPGMQDAYVDGMCAAGQSVDYRTYVGLGHIPLVEAASPLIPELLEWTRDRLTGQELTSTCR